MTSIKAPFTTIHVPLHGNKLLEHMLKNVNDHEELKTLWRINNVNAMDRLGMSDHGPVHFQIVSNTALRIARILMQNDIKMSLTENYGLSKEHAEVVILLSSLLHDVGMSVNREGHEEIGLFLAKDILKELLSFMSVEERVIITSEVLHGILNHRSGGKPLTIEAGILPIADALDMSQGRSRIPYEAGKVNIHSLSAYAVESVEIKRGKTRLVEITIVMNNSSGLFQVDELLKPKIMTSGIGQYVEVKAYVDKETEKNLLKEFRIDS